MGATRFVPFVTRHFVPSVSSTGSTLGNIWLGLMYVYCVMLGSWIRVGVRVCSDKVRVRGA